jgi:hypothetical protein
MNTKIAAREFFGKESKTIMQIRRAQSARLTRLNKFRRGEGLKSGTPKETYTEHISKTAQTWRDENERLKRLQRHPISESIGGLVTELWTQGVISPAQEQQVQGLLEGIFDPKGISQSVGVAQSMMYIDVLNSPVQALTQLEEISYSAIASPVRTIPAIARTLARKSQVTLKDIGITSIGTEYEAVSLKKALATELEITGFAKIDRMNKQNFINTTLSKMQAQAQRKSAPLMKKLIRVFGKDWKSVYKDLRRGRISEDVKYLLWSEVADIQPIAITEMPEGYNRGGNWRILYTLRSFYLKRFDYFRREAFQDMKSARTFHRGFSKLLWAATVMALCGAGVDALKDFVLGRTFDLSDSVVDTLLRIALLSKYTVESLERKPPSEVGAGELAPPLKTPDAAWRDINNHGRGWELWRSVPVVGELYYWWFGKGRQRIEDQNKTSRRRSRRRAG